MAVADRYDVMISYATADRAVADRVCSRLEQKGLCCWIAPRDVVPGASYAAEVIDAINSSRALVLVLSRRANESPHVLREVERAVSKGVCVIPFKTGSFELSKPMEYLVSSQHWFAAPDPPTDASVEQLACAVARTLSAPASGGSPTADIRPAAGAATILPAVLAVALLCLNGWLLFRPKLAASPRGTRHGDATNAGADSVSASPATNPIPDAYEPCDLKLSLWTNHGPTPIFREGDRVRVFARATHDCLVSVAYIAQDSSVTWLVPSDGGAPKRLPAGATIELTDEASVVVRPPFGNDAIRVFAAECRLPVESVFASNGRIDEKVLALRGLAEALSPAEMYAERSLPVVTAPRN
jgi:hypothetical protein